MNNYDMNQRMDDAAVQRESEQFVSDSPYTTALDMVSTMVLILNRQRQIVFANKELVRQLGFGSFREVLGLRPGEIIHCQHAFETPLGCGTAEACRHCTALHTVMRAMETGQEVREVANLVVQQGKRHMAMDMEINVAVYQVHDQDYYVVTMNDRGDQLRKTEMERIFFHDVLNTVGALRGYLRLVTEDIPEGFNQDMAFIHSALADLIEIVKVQKTLSELNTGEPLLHIEAGESLRLLQEVKGLMGALDEKTGSRIMIDEKSRSLRFHSDLVILKRILINMVKNALEATGAGDQITLGAGLLSDGSLELWVHNPGFIASENRSRIFSKAFSTKERGRGWGTYSMKLLGEGLLEGHVDFETDLERGTRFYLVLPPSIREER